MAIGFQFIQSNISCADLNVISRECAYYQDKSTNIWRSDIGFHLCAQDMRDEGPDYFHHPLSVSSAKTIHRIQINCCIHVHPVCIKGKLSLDTKHEPVWSHCVFWADSLTQIDSSRCVWRDRVRLMSTSPVTGCQYRSEAAALLPLALYCTFSRLLFVPVRLRYGNKSPSTGYETWPQSVCLPP